MFGKHFVKLSYQGVIGSIWRFEIAFPLKLSKHFHCEAYRLLLAFWISDFK